jgi:hypothetical protein
VEGLAGICQQVLHTTFSWWMHVVYAMLVQLLNCSAVRSWCDGRGPLCA